MSSLIEKFIKQNPEDSLIIAAQKLLEIGLITPLHSAHDRFSTEIIFHDELFEIELKIENRQLYSKCSCGTKNLCSHIVAALYLADQYHDLQLALKRNIKNELIINQKPAPQDSCDYHFEKESQSMIKPKAVPTFENFPNFEPVLQDKIVDFKQKLSNCLFSYGGDLLIDSVINIDESLHKNRLMIGLYYKVLSNGSYSKRIPLIDLADLPDNYSAIKLLEKFHHRPIPVAKLLIDTLPNVFSLPPEVAVCFLPLIANSNACYARKSCHEKQIWPLKLQTNWHLFFEFTQNSEGFLLSSYISNENEKIPLSSCDWISEAGLALKKQNLYIFNSFNSHDFILKSAQITPWKLSYAEMDLWLRNFL
ncbi:MAG: SWIM zinc finger family protein, partial [Lentisphaeria bacterium]